MWTVVSATGCDSGVIFADGRSSGSGANLMRSAHRDDIDGLRAVAVIPVVLFHFGIPGFSGGFVGVDVFCANPGLKKRVPLEVKILFVR